MSPRPTPPPVFALAILPFAAAVGYVSIAVPFWLEREGVSLGAIGTMSGIAMMPHAVKFLWAPLVDVGGRRRRWFVAMAALTAASLVALALFPDPGRHLVLFTALATACQAAGTTATIAADGLMALTTRDEDKGKAAGYRMAGNVGFTSVLGAAAIWIASRASAPVAGVAVAAATLASVLAMARVHEAPSAARPAGTAWLADVAAQIARIGRDLWVTVTDRQGWTGLVICAVPVGAGALTNLFSAMAASYRASENVVVLVNGLAGGAVSAVGALAGGYLADRMNRRLAYALAGGLTAGSALAMMFGPLTPATYVWGTLAYSFANGIAFAALAAFVLELVGHGPAAATKYTTFIAIANVASSYVTTLDGWGSRLWDLGVRGTILVDVVLTAAGIGVLLAMVAVTRRAPAASGAPAPP